MSLQVLPIPAFSDNYLWLLHNDARAVVVDPGDAARVEAALAERGLELCAILVTHHHGDHTGGIAALCAGRKIPVFGPGSESIQGITDPVGEGDRVALPAIGLELEVLAVPGHTLGHLAYAGAGMLFCGDTLFAGGCGRLFEGTPGQMHASLQRLARLSPDTRVYCAHEYTLSNLRFARTVEPLNAELADRELLEAGRRARLQPTLPSRIGLEQATNPFMRCDQPAVQEAASRRAGRPLTDPVEVFAVLRDWKNSF